MKNMMKKMSCFLLAVCLMLSLAPFSARADEAQQSVDFVLLLDCSGTMAKNDPKQLAADACKTFMELLPLENARIGVIAFGYGGSTYAYEHFTVKYDANLIQVLSGLEGDMTPEEQDALKEKISVAAKKEGDTTPIGQALAAGVDTLISGGSADGDACVVLLSDGGLSSPIAYGESEDLVTKAAQKAGEHDWPIFCIELDYKNNNEPGGSTPDNRKRLNRICELSGEGAMRMKVGDPADVTEALLTIFNHFMEIDPNPIGKIKLDDNGVSTQTFEVPQLASETTVIISGESVKYAELINPKGVVKKIDASIPEGEGDWIANVEPGRRISVKVVRPEAGEWTFKVYGDANASIFAYNSSLQELNMALIGSPASGKVTKNDTIHLQSYFTYAGRPLNNSSFYAENPASLLVTSYDANGDVKYLREFEMTGDTSGYQFDLAVKEIPSGMFTVEVMLKSGMFRSGEKTSNSLTYTSENLPLGHDETQNIDREGYVNADLEKINLVAVFPNPDFDPIEYEVTCVSDRNVKFEWSVDDDDYLYINTGLLAGTHQMQVTAKDPDMTEPHVHNFTITVENRSIIPTPVPDQEVWVNVPHGFVESDLPEMLDLDLNQYFTDPDGVPLTFGEITADVAGMVETDWQSGKLHVDPLAEGTVVLTTTVSDGVETVEAQIKIEIGDGWAEWWRTHWIYFAIAAAIILVIVVIALMLYKNKLVKGNWDITIENSNGDKCSYQNLNIVAATTVGKKHKFTLFALLQEVVPHMKGDASLKNTYMSHFNGGVESMELLGVTRSKGCDVKKIPTNGTVAVRINGLDKQKVQFSSGRLVFEINTPGVDASKLTVTMDVH